MGKLSIVTEGGLESGKLRINVADKKIYYGSQDGTVVLIEGSLKYRPLHCSELSKRLANRDWNKSETLFIQGDSSVDDPILRYKKSKPTGEIDSIDVDNLDTDLSFPLCGELSNETKELIDEAYSEIFDPTMRASEEVCLMETSKEVMKTSECQESIDIIKGVDSYTNSLDLSELIEYSSYPGVSCRLDLSIKYSKVENSIVSVYDYFTIIKVFEYDKDRNLVIEDTIEDIGDLIRIEYFNGTLRLFPKSPKISECIINDCTIIYGKFR